MKLTLPIYYKTKKSKILVGMNKYERMYFIDRNNMKEYYYSLIRSIVGRRSVEGKITTHYTLYYKNKLSDAPNVVAVIDKMLMDGLQECGAIKDDNVQHYISSSWSLGGEDKNNPRIEIKVVGAVEPKEDDRQMKIYDLEGVK